MSTPVSAGEVKEKTDVWHDGTLCHITTKKNSANGSVFLQWTENLFGTEALFGGSFNPNAYFGEQTIV